MMAKFDQQGFNAGCGELLAHWRKRKGFTQEKLSARIGIPRATLANMEKGRQRVHVDVWWRCAIVLGVHIEKLIPERA
jgi:transcriptional regulator with XRE-family HTH domain